MSPADPPHTTQPAPPESADAPTPLGRSAKRLFGWAVNLTAMAVVLAAGLTYGRQVLVWWRGEPSASSRPAAVAPRLGQETSPHRLAFGDVPLVFEREVMTGDRRAALARLVTGCRAIAAARPRVSEPAGPAELTMLRRIADRSPVVQTKDFRIYQLERPLPMATAVARLPAGDGSGPRDRVVSWGLAMPIGDEQIGDEQAPAAAPAADEQAWTLFTWSAGGGLRASPVQLPELPPGARRTLLLSAEDGSAVTAFQIEGPPRAVMDSLNDQFVGGSSDGSWKVVIAWRAERDVWHARFESARKQSVDVQLVMDDDGRMSGVMTVRASPENNEKQAIE